MKGARNVRGDFLSKFPMHFEDADYDEDDLSFLNFMEIETLSLVDEKQIVVESRRDQLINRVVEYVQTTWPKTV